MRNLFERALLLISMGCLFWHGATTTVAAGILAGSYQPIPSNSVVDLSAQGTLDWVHWGLASATSIDRKASMAPIIENFTPIIVAAGGGPDRFDDNFNGYCWKDGAPTVNATNSPTGVYVIGKSCGFKLKVPADTNPRTLRVYVGAFAAKGQFSASLSDDSAAAYSDSSIENVGNGPSGCYTINFAAGSTGQTLTVTYTVSAQYDHQYANVTLQAAALASGATGAPAASNSTAETKQPEPTVGKR